MKIAYISHPIGGEVLKNIMDVEHIVREINLTEPDVVPFAHYIVDCYCMNDDIPAERERGIKNDIALLRAGFITEMRLYGNRISSGMKAEILLARELGIEIISKSEGTKDYESIQ